jgi:hypothetical protein
MTLGGVEVVFVTVTVPLALVMTRMGATMRAVPAVRVDVDEAVVVVDDEFAVVAAAPFRRRLPSGVAARVGLNVAADVSVGFRSVVLAPVVGVAAIAAVVGVAVVLVIVGVAIIAAVVGVAVVFVTVGVAAIAAVVGVAFVAAIVGATVAAVAATLAAAVVPVPKSTAPPPSPVMTGIGSELIDAFTVACGFAYADGGMN